MNKKEITINGVNYPVVFTMDTLMNFERIVKKSFFESDLKTLVDRMALIFAAVVTADKETKLTIEIMKGNNDMEAIRQIIAAYLIVAEMMDKFFEVPEVVKKTENSEKADQPEPQKESESPKN